MKNIIHRIIVPVNLDKAHLSIARQAAELAAEHGAVIDLVHVMKIPFLFSHSMFPQANFISTVTLADQHKTILNTWKRWLEKEYKIRVLINVQWGNWKKIITGYAKKTEADVIALMQPMERSWLDNIIKNPVEYVIEKSKCQVITFFSEKEHISDWKNIVIPVTDFIPEQRIKTILEIARAYKIKLHLVTLGDPNPAVQGPGFPFVTGALKLLKSMGNVQVECCCIQKTSGRVNCYMDYAKLVNADVLMTRVKPAGDHGSLLKAYFKSWQQFKFQNYPMPTWQY